MGDGMKRAHAAAKATRPTKAQMMESARAVQKDGRSEAVVALDVAAGRVGEAIQAKHSPAPWFYDDGEGGEYFPRVITGGDNPKSQHGIIVNSCRGDCGGTIEECQSNAILMTASPDLLAASRKFLAFYNDLAKSNPGFMGKLTLQNYARWNEAMTELPAAIAKATGAA